MRSLFDFRRTTELIFQRERDREKHGSRDHNTRENIDFATVEKNRNNQSIIFFPLRTILMFVVYIWIDHILTISRHVVVVHNMTFISMASLVQ